jgi:hypothetical protein
LASLAAILVPLLKAADRLWLNEQIKDLYASIRHGEDWHGLAPISELDYRWLASAGPSISIAHALGGAGGPDANTLSAARRSLAAGIHFLEIDLWLDPRTGIVHCHHGPEVPSVVPLCRLEQVANLLSGNDSWLVLDLKTPFKATLRSALEILQARGMTERVIVQLYQPEDLAAFTQARKQYGLPGPIVATHLAHRSVNQVARASAQAGVQAISISLGRLPALSEPRGMAVLAHPVHDCGARHWALGRGARGFYITHALDCGDTPVTSTH